MRICLYIAVVSVLDHSSENVVPARRSRMARASSSLPIPESRPAIDANSAFLDLTALPHPAPRPPACFGTPRRQRTEKLDRSMFQRVKVSDCDAGCRLRQENVLHLAKTTLSYSYQCRPYRPPCTAYHSSKQIHLPGL